MFFRNGKATEYTGGRTSETIVSWLEKKTGPPARTLDTVEAVKAFIEDSEVAVVGFFKVGSLCKAARDLVSLIKNVCKLSVVNISVKGGDRVN